MRPSLESPDLDTTMAQRQASEANEVSTQNFVSLRSLTSGSGSLSTGTRALKPASAALNDFYFETDTKWLYYWSGTAWLYMAGVNSGTDASRAAITVTANDNGAWFITTDTKLPWQVSAGAWVQREVTGSVAWISWTPTWTNLTVGNGTVTARYLQIGKYVVGRLAIVFGSTTSVSGQIGFSPPVNIAAYAGSIQQPIGMARLLDLSAPLGYEGWVSRSSATLINVFSYAVSGGNIVAGATSGTAPFTWTTGDEIVVQFYYEAA